MKWTCESMKPGTTNCPPRSTISAPAARARTSAVVPTATMRSLEMAKASASGCEALPVHTRPLTSASVITGPPGGGVAGDEQAMSESRATPSATRVSMRMDAILIIPEDDDRIDAHGAPRRQRAGQDPRAEQQQCDFGE